MSRSRLLLALVLLPSVLGLAACERDDGESAGGPDTRATDGDDAPASDPPAPAQAPTTDVPADPDTASAPEVIDYVALGDSMATGAGATTSYVEEFAASLRSDTGADVEVTNFAVNGWTSADLLGSLRDDTGVREAVAGADLVTLDIGANDVLRALPAYAGETCGGDDNLQCLRDTTDTFTEQWEHILDEVLELREGDPTGVLTIDLYQPFVGDERLAGDLDRLRPSLDAVNATITDAAAARDIPVAGVHDAFHGPDGLGDPGESFLISVDGLHPSNAGHRLIADELLALDVAWPHTG